MCSELYLLCPVFFFLFIPYIVLSKRTECFLPLIFIFLLLMLKYSIKDLIRTLLVIYSFLSVRLVNYIKFFQFENWALSLALTLFCIISIPYFSSLVNRILKIFIIYCLYYSLFVYPLRVKSLKLTITLLYINYYITTILSDK